MSSSSKRYMGKTKDERVTPSPASQPQLHDTAVAQVSDATRQKRKGKKKKIFLTTSRSLRDEALESVPAAAFHHPSPLPLRSTLSYKRLSDFSHFSVYTHAICWGYDELHPHSVLPLPRTAINLY